MRHCGTSSFNMACRWAAYETRFWNKLFSLTYFKEYGGITCSVLSIDGWLLSVLVSLSACHVLCRWNWCSCADCWTLSRCTNDHLLHQYVWPWSYAGMYCPVRKCCGKSTLDTLSALILVAVILAGIPSQHSFCQRMSRKQLVKLFSGEGKAFNIYVVQSWKWIEGDEFVTSK